MHNDRAAEALLPLTVDSASPPVDARPKVGVIRSQMSPAGKIRSTAKGLALFCLSWGLYCAAFAGAVLAPHWLLQLICSILAGSLTGILFVIGHDACHGSLTSSNGLNKVLGRIAFLPSLHPYASWEFAHNRVHHTWTNLRGKDYAWAPYSKDEYDRLPRVRRGLERFYRTAYGLGLYYLLEYWWQHLMFPCAAEREEMRNDRTFLLDRLAVLAFTACQVAVVIALWRWWPSADDGRSLLNLTSGLGWGVVLPFLMLNWLIGFAIFQHHNHPEVAWYANEDDWDFFRGQVQGTTHVILPWGLGKLFHNIMEHTAHHANPRIPLYNLPECQRELEQIYPEDVAIEVWTLGRFVRNLGRCKLYDYTNHRWLNFAGKPTTWPIHERKSGELVQNAKCKMQNAK